MNIFDNVILFTARVLQWVMFPFDGVTQTVWLDMGTRTLGFLVESGCPGEPTSHCANKALHGKDTVHIKH